MAKRPELEVEDLLAEHERRAKEVQPLLDDVRLSKGLEEEEREEAAARALEERTLDSRTAAMEKELALIREQLHESNEFVRKYAVQGMDTTMMAAEMLAEQERRVNGLRYERIKAHGGYAVVLIHQNEHGDNGPVHICVNGDFINVPRGKPVRLHYKFLAALDNAIVEQHAKEVDGQGNPRTMIKRFLSYPYSVLDETGAQIIADRLEAGRLLEAAA
jgi:hypothetical protein